uniref:Packaging ATPase n=1 Tax=Megaviridae environmental sample TaxID=1737588 RepID=A0A5J6VJ15_9VIRU|nr:MAG: hypothetical protein [Megaviridae environmental sample]
MEKQTISLTKFTLDDLVDHSAITMIAKRASGKSFIVRELCYHLQKRMPNVIVIAPTDKLNGFFDTFIPSCFIHYEYEPEILENLFSRQEMLIEKNKQRKKDGKKLIDTRCLLIMDDCLASKGSWAKDGNILNLMQNGRHYHITYILTMQYALGITPELRSNFDFVYLLGEDFINNRKKLYEHYAGMFPSFDIFQQVFSEVTDNYGCMILNNRRKSRHLHEKVFWYRAQDPGDFMMGSNSLQKFNNKYYNPEWNKKKPIFDINKYINKKRNINVGVEMKD